MTSIGASVRQVDTQNSGYYVPITDCRNSMYVVNSGVVSTAAWSKAGPTSTLIATAGAALLRDMGKTFTSSARTFRKVQLLLPASASTFGVGGTAVATDSAYLTGYIELGGEFGSPTPVAKFGR